jgi:hypothetical protein
MSQRWDLNARKLHTQKIACGCEKKHTVLSLLRHMYVSGFNFEIWIYIGFLLLFFFFFTGPQAFQLFTLTFIPRV